MSTIAFRISQTSPFCFKEPTYVRCGDADVADARSQAERVAAALARKNGLAIEHVGTAGERRTGQGKVDAQLFFATFSRHNSRRSGREYGISCTISILSTGEAA